jgi:hypothetical protein
MRPIVPITVSHVADQARTGALLRAGRSTQATHHQQGPPLVNMAGRLSSHILAITQPWKGQAALGAI